MTTIREVCLFCKSREFEMVFEGQGVEFPVGNFVVEDANQVFHFIPYSVLACKECGTVQTKYLGDLNLIYENNFAGAYGTIRTTMNDLFAEFILENKEVSHVLEIGAGNGSLSESILAKQQIPYTIVDPSYCGPKENRHVISSFIESMEEGVDANVVVMSHVYEHFYEPVKVLEKIHSLKGVNAIYLSFPDLEGFIKENVYHVLNPEHTFYVENQFLVDVFAFHGFMLGRKMYHKNHSVFFEFLRTEERLKEFPKNKTTLEDTKDFFERAKQNIQDANEAMEEEGGPFYIWPCSMHTLFCLSLGLKKDSIRYVLDNSPLKIGKYLYGYKLKCVSFEEVIRSSESKGILLTGGCYNMEIKKQVEENKSNRVYIL